MRSARLSLEQIRGVEPPSSVWETEILTVVLYLHIDSFSSMQDSTKQSNSANCHLLSYPSETTPVLAYWKYHTFPITINSYHFNPVTRSNLSHHFHTISLRGCTVLIRKCCIEMVISSKQMVTELLHSIVHSHSACTDF